jgi:hypothetical protein
MSASGALYDARIVSKLCCARTTQSALGQQQAASQIYLAGSKASYRLRLG